MVVHLPFASEPASTLQAWQSLVALPPHAVLPGTPSAGSNLVLKAVFQRYPPRRRRPSTAPSMRDPTDANPNEPSPDEARPPFDPRHLTNRRTRPVFTATDRRREVPSGG